MAEGWWLISGCSVFMIPLAGQRGHDGITEACWDMKGYPHNTAGEQMV